MNTASVRRRRRHLISILSCFALLVVVPVPAVAADQPPPEAWVARYDGDAAMSASSSREAVVDGAGNVYVTGLHVAEADYADRDIDYITAKFDNTGTLVWTARYDGPDGGADEAAAIAIDGEGDVYVTGGSWSSMTRDDFATVKYDGANGTLLWVARYHSGGINFDRGVDIGVSGGAVVVTGEIHFPGHDIVTVGYDAATGIEQWSTTYGTSTDDEVPEALAVDTSGNTFVTGKYESGPPTWDWKAVTLKYNSTGSLMWESFYDHPYADTGIAVAVDAAGTPYVGIWSNDQITGTDVVVASYDATTGAQAWVDRYNGPGPVDSNDDELKDLDVDEFGHVIVTGSSQASSYETNSVTFMYTSTGTRLWTQRLTDGEYRHDPIAVVADGSGGAYMTARRSKFGDNAALLVRFDPNGTVLWSDTTEEFAYAAALGTDAAGNAYVVGGPGQSELVAVKYTSSGAHDWTASTSGGPSRDVATGMSLDADRNVIVAGSHVVKYDQTGTEMWALEEQAIGLAVDQAGSIFLIDEVCCDASNHSDFGVVKIGPDGTELWAKQVDMNQYFDVPRAVVTDAAGSVYVAGSAGVYTGSEQSDYGVAKFLADGTLAWTARYDASTAAAPFSWDDPAAMAIDADGNIYLTGRSLLGSGVFGTNGDYLTVKFDPDGAILWATRYDGPAGGSDAANAMVIDDAGNVYVTGSSSGGTSFGDYVTVKYDSAGIEGWAASHDGPISGYDAAGAIDIDAAGNVYVGGEVSAVSGPTTGNLTDVVTAKFDATGTQEWAVTYAGPGGGSDELVDMATDAVGNVYITVKSHVGPSYDYATIKYTTAGVQEWISTYDGPAANLDAPAGLELDEYGNVYVTGRSDGGVTGYDIATIKYLVNEPPVADAGGPYLVDEGATVVLDGSASTDPDGDPLTYEWDLDDDGTFDTSSSDPTTMSIVYLDGSAAATVSLRVTDEHGAHDTAEAEVVVANVAPTFAAPTVPTDPVPTGIPVAVSWSFTDPAGALDAPYVCAADFGEAIETATADGFNCSVTHSYAAAGIYSIEVSATDKDGDAASAAAEMPIVVFDPDGGFVTGGGWIESPAGAYVPDPTLTGKATFAFVSKYKKGEGVPSGTTQFRFATAGLHFSSTSYDWLVVTGNDAAKFKGTGTINGTGDYRFMVWAGDDTPDTLRIKIWIEDELGVETVVYDNASAQAIAGGNIVVHRK